MPRLTRPAVIMLLRAAESWSDAEHLRAKERRDLDRGVEWLRARAAGPAAKEKAVPITPVPNGSATDSLSDDGEA